MYRKRKDIRKRRYLAAFVVVPSDFWGEVSNSWILNDIGRNFLLGSRKKLDKCLMRTFACRSTFLNDYTPVKTTFRVWFLYRYLVYATFPRLCSYLSCEVMWATFSFLRCCSIAVHGPHHPQYTSTANEQTSTLLISVSTRRLIRHNL